MTALSARTSGRIIYAVASFGVTISCGGDSGAGPKVPGAASQVTAVSGTGQQGPVGTQLSQPLVVKVTDAAGVAVPGQSVQFVVVMGGGKLATATVVTTTDGTAADQWTLGTVSADSQKVEARVVETASGRIVATSMFTATALAGPATGIVKVGGDLQTGTAGDPLADSVRVRIVDQHGNGVAGRSVMFAVEIASVSPSSALSDTNGFASARWTLAARVDSSQHLTVSAATLPTVDFSALATVPASAVDAKVAGDTQSAGPGTALADSLVLKVTLADGRPRQGARIVWTVAAGGGSVSPSEAITDVAGRAAAQWTLGSTTANEVVATVQGVGTLHFTATAIVEDLTSITVTPDSAILQNRTTRQFSAAVTDSSGRPVANPIVGWFTTSTTIATVADGLVTAKTGGTTRIIATYHGKSDTSLVTVVGSTVASLTINVIPSKSAYAPGDSAEAKVQAVDPLGAPFDPPPVTFSATGTAASLRVVDSATAMITFRGDGDFVVTASAGGKSAAIALTGYKQPTWESMASGTTANLNDVWGNSMSDVYAVGVGGTILHFDGSSWSEQTAPTTASLTRVWGMGPTRVYATDGASVLLRYDGVSWRAVLFPPRTLDAIWVNTETDAVQRGAGAGANVQHWDGSTWTTVLSGIDYPTGPWMGPDGSALVGQNTSVGQGYYWDGTVWQGAMPIRNTNELMGKSIDNFWGQNTQTGSCCTWSHYSSPLSGSTDVRYRTDAQAIFTGFPRITRPLWYYEGAAWVVEYTTGHVFRGKQDEGITAGNAMWGQSASDVFMVGDGGSIVRRRP